MPDIHTLPAPLRAACAFWNLTVGEWRHPSRAIRFLRAMIKYPLEYTASCEVSEVPACGMAMLLGSLDGPAPDQLDERHGWNVRLDEQIYIGEIIRALGAKSIFEIGTFDGRTTRHMAEQAGPDARIFTLDLPESEFDQTQHPDSFNGALVGREFRHTEVALRITQLRGNSQTFDFSPYFGKMDLVFVDAAHDYPNGLSDSRTALRLVRRGGVILWHDFAPGWPGLVHAIREATIGLPLQRVGATSLGMVKS